MSELQKTLNAALKDAMRAKDAERRNVLRLLNSAIKQVAIDRRQTLDDEAILSVLQSEAKKQRETIAELDAAGRAEESASARFELTVMESFLPSRLDDSELRGVIQAAIDDIDAASMKDMGQIMQTVMPQVRGRADGRQVSAMVRELLS